METTPKASPTQEQSPRNIETRGEHFSRASRETARFIGNTAVGLLLPLATEVIQRRTVDLEAKRQYRIDHPRATVGEKAVNSLSAFRGSVEDFKKINKKLEEQKQSDKLRRRQARTQASGPANH